MGDRTIIQGSLLVIPAVRPQQPAELDAPLHLCYKPPQPPKPLYPTDWRRVDYVSPDSADLFPPVTRNVIQRKEPPVLAEGEGVRKSEGDIQLESITQKMTDEGDLKDDLDILHIDPEVIIEEGSFNIWEEADLALMGHHVRNVLPKPE